MLLAIKSVIDDRNSYTKASTNYNASHSTLQDRVKKIKKWKNRILMSFYFILF
jgi:hypothetical protein